MDASAALKLITTAVEKEKQAAAIDAQLSVGGGCMY